MVVHHAELAYIQSSFSLSVNMGEEGKQQRRTDHQAAIHRMTKQSYVKKQLAEVTAGRMLVVAELCIGRDDSHLATMYCDLYS